ncbi:hypothetical protein ACFSQU_11810 [Massilia sp. GCM10020059]|nr:hypothetical protein [Massilia agrisoli]
MPNFSTAELTPAKLKSFYNQSLAKQLTAQQLLSVKDIAINAICE